MKDYTLSPVFNIRGRDVITPETQFAIENVYEDNDRKYIPIDK